MNMDGFEWHEKNEQNLKEMAQNYVHIWKGNWEKSDSGTYEPFLVINQSPKFWWDIPGILHEVSQTSNLISCGVAGPYDLDTGWLPDSWGGDETYVYQQYIEGEVSEGVEFSEDLLQKKYAIEVSDLAAHLQTDTSPQNRLPINGLSPVQYFMVMSHCAKLYGESVDITKNNFNVAPFIFRFWFDLFFEDNEADVDEMVNLLETELQNYIQALSNTTNEKILCIYFKP